MVQMKKALYPLKLGDAMLLVMGLCKFEVGKNPNSSSKKNYTFSGLTLSDSVGSCCLNNGQL